MARAGMLGKILASGSAVAFTLAAAPVHRQNLFTYSDPTTVDGTTFPTNSNVTAVTSSFITHPGGGTFAGGVVFGDNGSDRTAYKTVSTLSVGARYIMSAYVLMGDAAAPAPGSGGTKDFNFYFNGADYTTAADYTVTSVGSSVYRVSVPIIYASGTSYGVHKATTHSAKTFKVTGFQLEKVPSVSSTVGTYTPTEATAEYGKFRLSASSQRVWDATATVTVLEEAMGAKSSDPATLPTGTVNCSDVAPNGNWLAVGMSASPYIHVYAFDSTTGAIGAKSSDPATLPAGNVFGVAFSPDGAYLACAHAGSPFVSVYAFNSTTGAIGAKVSDAATLPAARGLSVAWKPDGTALAVGHDNSPYITAWPWSGGAFGTKYSDPSTLPAGSVNGVAWSPSGANIATAHDSSPYVGLYAWSGGFGAKASNPGTLPAGNASSVSWHPAGGYLAVSHAGSPYLTGYPISSGAFGTKLADPATLPTGIGNCVRFSPSGDHLAVAHTTSPFASVYPFAGAYAPKLANPSTLPPATGLALAWSPNGKWLGHGSSSTPYLHVYQFSKASTETWTPNRLDGWIQAAAANYTRQGMLISSSYLPMTVFSEARAFSLKCSADALDSTAFQSTWKSFKQGLNQASGSLEAFRTTDATLVTALTAKTPLVLEFWDNTTDSSEPIARVRALAKGHGTDTSVADLVKEGFEFEAMADSDNRVIAFPFLAL